MGTYNASLRAVGDTRPVPATLLLQDGQLAINSGDVEIGAWALSDISLEPIPTGYRMAAEGEQIIIEIKELDAFREALANGRFKRRSARPKSDTRRPKSDTRRQKKPKTEQTAVVEAPARPAPAKTGIAQKGLSLIDGTMDTARKRWGSYLPEWVFTRAMFIIVFVALLLMLIFPGVVSLLLLISSAVLIVFGAVAYTDPMLASRWLPGRTNPSHVLLVGVIVLIVGVLLGVIAN